MTSKPPLKLLPHAITAKKNLKPVKSTVRFKKADVRQCRLCLRVLPRGNVRLTVANDAYDFRRKISDAVGVQITDDDKVQGVCSSCLLLVDIIGNFRESCQKADTIHRKRLLMMHPGSWTSDDNGKLLQDCHNLVKRNRAEVDALFQCMERREEEDAQRRKQAEELARSTQCVVAEDDDQDMDAESDNQPTVTESNSPEPHQPTRNPMSARKTVMCDICGEFQESYKMEGHRNSHDGVRPFACAFDGCRKRFFCSKSLTCHVNCVHTGDTPLLECETCGRMIKGKTHFKRHMATHEADAANPRKSGCHICGKMFYKDYLKDHMAVHTGNLAYKCDFCDRSFAAMNNLITHYKKVHPDVERVRKGVSQQLVVDGVYVE